MSSISNNMDGVQVLLSTAEAPEDDLNFYSDRRMPETCSWILSDPDFDCWMKTPLFAQALWINGPAGTGKSILASFLIHHFQSQGIRCNYFFFRSGDRSQRSANSFLRSLAFQIAQTNRTYKHSLEQLSDTGVRLEKADVKTLWQKLFISMSGQLQLSGPISVIVDGLDESDSPRTLLALMSSIPADLPLHLVVVSRFTSALSSSLDRFPNSMPVARISAENTTCDIPLFVERQLLSMHGHDSLRQKVTGEVIDRASGSFLWVHLATQEILNCHTQGEIEQVLQDIPTGMQPLYERMEEAMARTLKPADQRLARTLLSWVACSQYPLSLDELAEAIEPEFPHVIDLKFSIGQVCGNLMIVDRKSRVLFVHQTAREFLTKMSTGPFTVAPAKVHGDLFLRCMASLYDPRLRSQLGYSTLPTLASYAARSWPFHLQAQSAGSERTLTALMTFLQGSFVLAWIQMLATQNQLHVLVHASRSLAIFAEKQRTLDASLAPNLRPLQALETIELWISDLVKIVGKFGRRLLETPDAIFKFVTQFCPQNSIINRQFGRRGAFSVEFSGTSNASWDDSLAKLFVGPTSQALSLICAGRYFAILTSSDSILLWDSTTCQKSGEIHHGEHVAAICASNSGKLIASYGFRSTKVWDVATGKESISIPNSGDKALAFLFSLNDTELLAGSDDRVVRAITLNNHNAGWQKVGPNLSSSEATLAGTTLNSPCSIAFSPDGNQVAMAFRGAPLSVWGVMEPELIGRCRRDRKDKGGMSARAWTAVDSVLWHPQSGDVLGIYQDGIVFKWNPHEDSSYDLSVTASIITCSTDGDIFATSDTNGTISIWKYYDVALIYQLKWEYPVTSLTFSVDNRRLYDLRGCFCNVWEPNALIRLSDLEAAGSEARSESGITLLSTAVSEAEVEIVEPVSALSVEPHGHLYCTGNTEGVVRLAHHEGQEIMELWKSRTFMPIEHIVWGADGKHIVFRDLGGTVIVQNLAVSNGHLDTPPQPARTIFSETIQAEDGAIDQLILSPRSDLLLIASAMSAQVWSVQNGSCIARWKAEDVDTVFKWISHPSHPDRLLRFNANKAVTCKWHDLFEDSTILFHVPASHEPSRSSNTLDRIRKPSLPRSMSSEDSGAIIDSVVLTQDDSHLMIESSRFFTNNESERHLMIFTVANFEGTSRFATPRSMPAPLFDRLQLPLGILPGDAFVFLDNDHWVCTWRLETSDGTSGVERHFFLPRDWLNAECLELCRVTEDGVLLIPKNGDVAFIKSRLSMQW